MGNKCDKCRAKRWQKKWENNYILMSPMGWVAGLACIFFAGFCFGLLF